MIKEKPKNRILEEVKEKTEQMIKTNPEFGERLKRNLEKLRQIELMKNIKI